MGLRSQPSIEEIARLKPDLIVADLNRHQALYSDLASIAPTLLLPSRGEDYEGSLKSAELIGKALGKSPQMEARIAQNRANLTKIAQHIPAGASVLFGVAREDSFSVHGPDSYAGRRAPSHRPESAFGARQCRPHRIRQPGTTAGP